MPDSLQFPGFIAINYQLHFYFSYFLISRQIKSGPYKSLYRPGNMISGKEDAANNFARGHYTVGKEILEDVLEEVKCDTGNWKVLNGVKHVVTCRFGGKSKMHLGLRDSSSFTVSEAAPGLASLPFCRSGFLWSILVKTNWISRCTPPPG